MIKVVNLDFEYDGNKVIDNCSLNIKSGKICCLLGRNGCGKTTLLRIVGGTLKPKRGKVFVNDIDVNKESKSRVAKLIGYVPQEHNGVFPYKVVDMVVMGRAPYLKIYSRPSKKDYMIAKQALDDLGILKLESRNYMELSGGEKQMVFIARALAQEAQFLLLDEPTSHLDFYNQQRIIKTLKKVAIDKGCGILVSMHDPNQVVSLTDEVAMMKNGKIVRFGESLKLMNEVNLRKLYDIDLMVVDLSYGKRVVIAE